MIRFDYLQKYFTPELLATAIADELDCEVCPAKEVCPDGVSCTEHFCDGY